MITKPEYLEGVTATKNFEEGLKALFKVPEAAIGPAAALTAPSALSSPPRGNQSRRGFEVSHANRRLPRHSHRL
jgi:hypothetical protein